MKKINTPAAPAAIGQYSQAVDAGVAVYTSGQLGIDPKTGELGCGIEEQTELSLKNIKAILAAAGLSMDNIVKTLVFITDMNDFAKVNAVYAKYICGDILPARSCVEISKLPRGGLVEIEAIAVR